MPDDTARRILIVEDDKHILNSLCDLLTEEGFTVSIARNGQEALDYLRRTQELPALILLDIMMPVKDGIAFRREQESDPQLANIPVIAMSTDGQIEITKIRLGLKRYLKKPLDVDTVVETVKGFFDGVDAT